MRMIARASQIISREKGFSRKLDILSFCALNATAAGSYPEIAAPTFLLTGCGVDILPKIAVVTRRVVYRGRPSTAPKNDHLSL